MNLFPVARPLLHSLDPERAHRLTLWGLRHGFGPHVASRSSPALEQTLWGRRFPNPVGLAAGFDKDAEAVGAALDMGFGFVEVGSITPRPQPGNPKPRVFRLPEDGGVINRMGFNSGGLDAAEANLRAYRNHPRTGVVGINLGKNKDSTDAAADYEAGVRRLGAMADYLVLNVSSPNTPGLRALQSRADLEALLDRVYQARDSLEVADVPPILLKIAPDLTDEDMTDIAEVACGPHLDGLIISNTTIERPEYLKNSRVDEKGGLSGRPLFQMATDRLRSMYHLTKGQVPIIGVGGIDSTEAALEKFYAGASLVEIYSALIYQGPKMVLDIIKGVEDHIRYHGYQNISELLGRHS